ncbi:hypothetical protein Tco_0050194, partial [Tanacetum coccineum]
DNFEEVLKIKKLSHYLSGSTTSTPDSSPSVTPVETSDYLFEEFADELALLDPFLPGIGDAEFDLEGDIHLLEKLLNNDPSSPLPPKELNFEELNFEELKTIKSLIYDFPPLDVLGGNSVIFSNPLSISNEDFTSSNDESPLEVDVLEENFKIYSNPLLEFDEEYISSDENPLFDEVLENIESKDSYVSNFDEPAFFDANVDECFDPGGGIDEIDAFLDIDVPTEIKDGYHDSEGDIIYFESLLINDTFPNLPPKVFLDHDPKSLNNKPDNLKSMVKVFDPGIWEKTFSPTYVKLPFEDRHYLSVTYVIQIFLPYFTYPVDSSLPLSSS